MGAFEWNASRRRKLERMIKKLVRIFKALCFCLVTVLLFNFLSTLFTPKWLENRWSPSKTAKTYYDIEDNTLNTLMVGSSVSAAAVDPMQLYKDYGISTYNMSLMTEPTMGSYYWMLEMLKNQKPKVVIMEIKTVGRKSNKEEKKARKSYDYMRWGENKIHYAKDTLRVYKSAKKWDYLFPMSMYHNRWSELESDDWDFAFGNYKANARGFCFLNKRCSDTNPEKADYKGIEIDSNKKSSYTFNKVNKKYLDKIIDKCAKEKIKLVMIKTPDTAWKTASYNYINQIAKEHKGVEYIDFNEPSIMESIGFDYGEDAEDAVHINIKGAKKVTKYLGEYISKKYKMDDARKNKRIKESFEDEFETYQLAYNNAIKTFGQEE